MLCIYFSVQDENLKIPFYCNKQSLSKIYEYKVNCLWNESLKIYWTREAKTRKSFFKQIKGLIICKLTAS